MKAIEELKNEHRGIQLMLRVLERIAGKGEGGEPVRQDHLSGILEFLTIFVDKCHHGKEENFLFPMAEERLDAGMDATLYESFEQLEREQIGEGKHEEFHALLTMLNRNTFVEICFPLSLSPASYSYHPWSRHAARKKTCNLQVPGKRCFRGPILTGHDHLTCFLVFASELICRQPS